MSTLSVSNINGVTGFSGGIFDTLGNTANGANATAIAAFGQANNVAGAVTTANNIAIAAFTQANSGLPSGSIITKVWNNGDAIPTGFLRLDGNLYSRTTYSDLANTIGTPTLIGNFTTKYTNTSLILSDVYDSNGVVFHNGTSIANVGQNTTANSLIYSTDGGTTWISAAAQGVDAPKSSVNRTNYTGSLSGVFSINGGSGSSYSSRPMSRVASNGRGTFVITNTSANGTTNSTGDESWAGVGNAYIMVSGTADLNTWTKVVVSTANSINTFGSEAGSWIAGVAFGGTENRFVALFNGGSVDPGCCGQKRGFSNKIGWSNNGTTWTWQSSNAVIGASNSAYNFGGPGSIPGTTIANRLPFKYYYDVAGSANGFIALTNRVDQSNAVLTSADGITWTDISNTVYNAISYDASTQDRFVSYANNLWIIASSSRLAYSSDRVNWTTVNYTSGFSPQPRNIKYNGKIYYTSTTAGNFYYSTNLSDWYLISSSGFNIIPNANVGNVIFGQASSNTALANGYITLPRGSINTIDHNTYNLNTQFPLHDAGTQTIQSTGATGGLTGYNPAPIKSASFIKT
jgi:hypothetical protein